MFVYVGSNVLIIRCLLDCDVWHSGTVLLRFTHDKLLSHYTYDNVLSRYNLDKSFRVTHMIMSFLVYP